MRGKAEAILTVQGSRKARDWRHRRSNRDCIKGEEVEGADSKRAYHTERSLKIMQMRRIIGRSKE